MVCKEAALAVLRPMPKLDYQCGEEAKGWDEKELTSPTRVAALKLLTAELSTMTSAAWWQANVEELNACDFKGAPGVFTAEERENYADGDYWFWLFGNNHVRLLLIPDPCYQTEYNGSNAFLLYRKERKVFVRQVLDGYFSRADKSVDVKFGRLNDELIIEVATGSGGLNPSLTNYYFTIDRKTNRIVPKKLFSGDHGPTNRIYSAAPLDGVSQPLNIIRGRSLAKSFSVYSETSNEGSFSRTVKHWNGKLYR